MTAKEYLMLTDILLNRIKQKEEEIEMNYDEIRDCKVTMSDGTENGKNENGTELKLCNYIDKINKLQQDVLTEKERLLAIKIDIRKKINQLELKYPKSCLLLTDRYILHKSFKEIFERSKYTEINPAYFSIDITRSDIHIKYMGEDR